MDLPRCHYKFVRPHHPLKFGREIRTPAKQTSSLAFGGPELTDIFITSAAKSEPMPIMPPMAAIGSPSSFKEST